MNGFSETRIVDNLARVTGRIRRAERKAGRPEGYVTLVGVTKNRTVEEIEAALGAGLEHIGENRLQEAAEKFPRLKLPATRHFIGHLQRNKARDVLALCQMIQSVDSERLALALGQRAEQAGLTPKVLMQVNTSGESSKFGIGPERADELFGAIQREKRLHLLGLMTIGPLTDNLPEITRSFRLLRKLFERYAAYRSDNCRMEILSMGMSADFEIAIAEGASMVRVGTAIFGPQAG